MNKDVQLSYGMPGIRKCLISSDVKPGKEYTASHLPLIISPDRSMNDSELTYRQNRSYLQSSDNVRDELEVNLCNDPPASACSNPRSARSGACDRSRSVYYAARAEVDDVKQLEIQVCVRLGR